MSHASNGKHPTVTSYIATYGHSCAVAVHASKVATAKIVFVFHAIIIHNSCDQSFTIISNR